MDTAREEKRTFEDLFRELYRPVCQIFAKKGCSLEECQDLASETFVRAYRSFDDYRGEAKPFTWLHTIATNVWINKLRAASAAKRDGVEVPILDDGQADSAFQARPQDHVILEERKQLLKSAIGELPPKMRRCVWLRVYQDMNFREIAESLDVSVATAKSHVSRAQAQLRSRLSDHYPDLDSVLSD